MVVVISRVIEYVDMAALENLDTLPAIVVAQVIFDEGAVRENDIEFIARGVPEVVYQDAIAVTSASPIQHQIDIAIAAVIADDGMVSGRTVYRTGLPHRNATVLIRIVLRIVIDDIVFDRHMIEMCRLNPTTAEVVDSVVTDDDMVIVINRDTVTMMPNARRWIVDFEAVYDQIIGSGLDAICVARPVHDFYLRPQVIYRLERDVGIWSARLRHDYRTFIDAVSHEQEIARARLGYSVLHGLPGLCFASWIIVIALRAYVIRVRLPGRRLLHVDRG